MPSHPGQLGEQKTCWRVGPLSSGVSRGGSIAYSSRRRQKMPHCPGPGHTAVTIVSRGLSEGKQWLSPPMLCWFPSPHDVPSPASSESRRRTPGHPPTPPLLAAVARKFPTPTNPPTAKLPHALSAEGPRSARGLTSQILRAMRTAQLEKYGTSNYPLAPTSNSRASRDCDTDHDEGTNIRGF